jgi:hypothetical protein
MHIIFSLSKHVISSCWREPYPDHFQIERSTMLVRILAIVGCFGSTVVSGFVIPTASTAAAARTVAVSIGGKGRHRLAASSWDNDNDTSNNGYHFDPLDLASSSKDDDGQLVRASSSSSSSSSLAIITALPFLLSLSTPLIANANDSPNWGLFEGRTGSLLHPIAMISMAAFSVSTALLGFQWKRQRTIGDEISTLKKSLPPLRDGATSVKEALAMTSTTVESGETVTMDASYISALKNGLEIENKIDELTNERKVLANAGPRDKHFNQGALLLFVGTAFAIEVSNLSSTTHASCVVIVVVVVVVWEHIVFLGEGRIGRGLSTHYSLFFNDKLLHSTHNLTLFPFIIYNTI